MPNSSTKRLLALWLALLSARVAAQQSDVVVTLIGTGGPELTPYRSGIATLIQARGESFLFDAGRNALDRIYEARILPQSVTKIFLTHLHNDHIEGLPSIWITPWFLLGRTARLRIWGPAGTTAMIQGMRSMYKHDLDRRSNAVLRRENLDIEVHEIADGVVYSEGGVQITAFPVDHDDGNPALAYRIDAARRSVLITGDTTLTASLKTAGKSVDVVISNVAAGTPALEQSDAIKPILAKLMRPEQAGELFTLTSPRLAVFSHIVKKGLPETAGDAVILRRTRQAGYSGPLKIGQDGMTIVIGDKIRVLAPPSRQGLRDFDGPSSRF